MYVCMYVYTHACTCMRVWFKSSHMQTRYLGMFTLNFAWLNIMLVPVLMMTMVVVVMHSQGHWRANMRAMSSE